MSPSWVMGSGVEGLGLLRDGVVEGGQSEGSRTWNPKRKECSRRASLLEVDIVCRKFNGDALGTAVGCGKGRAKGYN